MLYGFGERQLSPQAIAVEVTFMALYQLSPLWLSINHGCQLK